MDATPRRPLHDGRKGLEQRKVPMRAAGSGREIAAQQSGKAPTVKQDKKSAHVNEKEEGRRHAGSGSRY